MGKLLFWVVAILAVMIVIRILNYQKSIKRQKPASREQMIRQSAEEMVPCAHCDVYLPQSQAHKKHGQYWCSADHARKGPK